MKTYIVVFAEDQANQVEAYLRSQAPDARVQIYPTLGFATLSVDKELTEDLVDGTIITSMTDDEIVSIIE